MHTIDVDIPYQVSIHAPAEGATIQYPCPPLI